MPQQLFRTTEDAIHVDDVPTAIIATSLSIPLLEAARLNSAAALTAKWPDGLQPSIVAILCAGAAIEAATNWYATTADGGWLAAIGPEGQPNEKLPPDKKWESWIRHRTGAAPEPGLLTRVRELTGDRALIGHDRGLPGPGGSRVYHWPPTRKRGGMSRTRAYFDGARANSHVETAEEAIEVLRSLG